MFKNHALRFQVVKNPQSDADTERRFRSMVEIVQYNKLLKDNLHYVAVLTGSAYVLKKLADTGSEVAILAAKHYFK